MTEAAGWHEHGFHLPLSLQGAKRRGNPSQAGGFTKQCSIMFISLQCHKCYHLYRCNKRSDRRVYEHKHNFDPNSFTARYSVHKLVYFEETTDVRSAIAREKQIKSWSRKKKNQLIETMNPMWEDLYDKLLP